MYRPIRFPLGFSWVYFRTELGQPERLLYFSEPPSLPAVPDGLKEGKGKIGNVEDIYNWHNESVSHPTFDSLDLAPTNRPFLFSLSPAACSCKPLKNAARTLAIWAHCSSARTANWTCTPSIVKTKPNLCTYFEVSSSAVSFDLASTLIWCHTAR